ncbi:hypothetical protein EJ08DRAFT_632435 [Tothia fuscella]|uniref:Histidine kinase n=1 Tax=Tothia fuscella TaxID=1048955 RepID=A0A9P4TYY1_9PEZI|nr:hypothetical protein EJ08DRAFT_632435 [Tothia fuscella]
MIEMGEIGMFEVDALGEMRWANESWYKLSGHPVDKAQHADYSWASYLHPEDADAVMRSWNRMVSGFPETFELRFQSKQLDPETNEMVIASCVPVFNDETNQVVSIAGILIDITAQKEIQQEAIRRAEALERAQASEKLFARFAELAPAAIYIFHPGSGMQYCNDRFFDLTGHPRVQANSEVTWTQAVWQDDLGLMESAWTTMSVGEEQSPIQVRLCRTWSNEEGAQGPIWAQAQFSPELNSDCSLKSILGTLTDISPLKFAEQIQRKRIEDQSLLVEEALEAKRQQENFIDMTSHEMRNPLSAVVQCADSALLSLEHARLLSTNACPLATLKELGEHQDDIQEALQTIIACSLHQKRIVDDILTLSKLDSNLIVITPTIVRPIAVLEDGLSMFRAECKNEKIDLAFREDPSLAAEGAHWVSLDPSRLLQIIINFLTNSIKFTRGRPISRITVTLGASSRRPPERWGGITFAPCRIIPQDMKSVPGFLKRIYLWIKVEDTGCGLTKAQQGRLFHRFSQATVKTHVQYGGSGLGLYISKSLAELMNGAVGVCSEPDQGSTFAVFVSTCTAPPPTRGESPIGRELQRSYSGALTPVSELSTMFSYSVLIVEDNVVNQKVLSKQLQRSGFKVHVANHGLEALEFLRTTKLWRRRTQTGVDLHIILMDVEMPVMDGLTCTRTIRELQDRGEIVSHIPILAVSANARGEQIAETRKAGMDDAISKPFRIPELLPKIEFLARRGTDLGDHESHA